MLVVKIIMLMCIKKVKIFYLLLLLGAFIFAGVAFIVVDKSLLFADNGSEKISTSNSVLNIVDYDISEFFYYQQGGKSSWYGRKFHKRRTASGEIYDMYKFTAAHRSLPFGTIVRVRNLENDKVVLVKVNDRGPFINSKVIDLSYYSAKTLGSIGNSQVLLEALIPQEENDIDLSENYYFGYSYEYPLVCIPESKVEILKEFSDFCEAIFYYNDILNSYFTDFVYIFVPSTQTKRYTKLSSKERYLVGKFVKGPAGPSLFHAEKQKPQ